MTPSEHASVCANEGLKLLWWNGDGVGQDRPPTGGNATDRQMSFPPKTASLALIGIDWQQPGGYDSDETVTKFTINY